MQRGITSLTFALLLILSALSAVANAPVINEKSKNQNSSLNSELFEATTVRQPTQQTTYPLYDRTATVAYADLHANTTNYNPDYGNYAGLGGDCANFVSQCLIAGGINFWRGSDGSGSGLNYYANQSGTLINCNDLATNLVNYQNVTWSYIEWSGAAPSWLSPGDVIIYGDASNETSPDYWRHAVIVVEGYGSDAKISAHTTDRYHVAWTYAFPSSFHRTNFYHLPNGTISEYTQFRVNTTSLNVRIGPGVQAPYNTPLGQIQLDQEYIAYEYVINATGKKWWHFWYDYRNAWCSAASTAYTEAVNENIKFRVDLASYLNVRTGPGTSYSIVNRTFNAQTFVAFELVVNGSLEWYHFWYRGRDDTWCCANYTVPIKNTTIHTISGWLPYWSWSTGFETFDREKEKFDEILPFWYKANADGSLTTYSGASNQTFVKFAHDNRVKIIPLISNEYNKTLVNEILSNQTIIESHATNITNLVVSNNYDGIDIDYEGLYASDKNNFTSFISKLANLLHDKNKLLSVCVQAKWSDSITWDGPGAMDYENLSKYADCLRIMAYDEHWSTSEPGPIASYGWVENVVKYAITKASKDKIILGVPFYGRDWWQNPDSTWSSTAYTYKSVVSLMSLEGAVREWNDTTKVPNFTYYDYQGDGKNHYMYYEDNQSLSFKLDFVINYELAGICAWSLGNEDLLGWSVSNKKFSIGKKFAYYLNQGWNFITLPLNVSYTAETLAQNITNCTYIEYWNTTLQKFVVYEKGSGINDFNIQAGVGYYVYVYTKSRINVTGNTITMLTLNLYNGWNAVGWCNFTVTNAESLARNITNCTAIACWNAQLGRFITHPANTELSNFLVERGVGLLVYVNTASTYIKQT